MEFLTYPSRVTQPGGPTFHNIVLHWKKRRALCSPIWWERKKISPHKHNILSKTAKFSRESLFLVSYLVDQVGWNFHSFPADSPPQNSYPAGSKNSFPCMK